MNKRKLDFAVANTPKSNFSVLYFTGLHSGKSSTSKMLKMATDEHYNLVRYFSIFYNIGMLSADARLATFYPIYDHIFMLQFLKQLNNLIDVNNYNIIMALRDPRDLLASFYYNTFTHPPRPGTNKNNQKINDLKEMGIDKYALNKVDSTLNTIYFPFIEKWKEHRKNSKKNRLFNSYSLLCINPDLFLKRMLNFLNIKMNENERMEISSKFILNKPNAVSWKHKYAKPNPSRYKEDFKDSTIEILNEKCKQVIDFFVAHEIESIKYIYK